jgi:hypothetical protein
MKQNSTRCPRERRNNAHNTATEKIKKKKILVLCAGVQPEMSMVKDSNSPI